MRRRLSALAVALLSLPVLAWRYLISPLMPPACRYMPSCSEYALDALRLHGPVGGSVLTLRRLCRCHPFGDHGYDPVPPAGTSPFARRIRAGDDSSARRPRAGADFICRPAARSPATPTGAGDAR